MSSPTPPPHPPGPPPFSPAEIQQIISTSLPNSRLISQTALPHGSSYNNRLYDVRVRISPSPGGGGGGADGEEEEAGTGDGEERSYMLKLCGRFWRQHKTVNEVMCLKLVRGVCRAEVVVPEVVAWSGGGSLDGEGQREEGQKEWILMTRLAGKPLCEEDKHMNEVDRACIMQELAGYLAALRSIHSPGLIGNLERVDDDGEGGEFVRLGRLVDCPGIKGWPWKSYMNYMKSLLDDSVTLLKTETVYERNRFMVPLLETFVERTLPELPLFQNLAYSKSVFTHTDLSDRNILVSRSQSPAQQQVQTEPTASAFHISGLVDWEFSGFFPPFEEFLSISDEMLGPIEERCSEAALPESPYAKALLAGLQREEMAIPGRGFPTDDWEQAKTLYELRENVAPWWLRDGGVKGDKLADELDAAADIVQSAMKKLCGFVAPSNADP